MPRGWWTSDCWQVVYCCAEIVLEKMWFEEIEMRKIASFEAEFGYWRRWGAVDMVLKSIYPPTRNSVSPLWRKLNEYRMVNIFHNVKSQSLNIYTPLSARRGNRCVHTFPLANLQFDCLWQTKWQIRSMKNKCSGQFISIWQRLQCTLHLNSWEIEQVHLKQSFPSGIYPPGQVRGE